MRRQVETALPAVAAGNDWSYTPSGSDKWRLRSLYAKLATSATVASRIAHLQVVDRNGNVVVDLVPQVTAAASSTTVYSLYSAGQVPPGGANIYDGVSNNVPPDLCFPATWKLQSKTTGLAAGDQWSDVYAIVTVGDEYDEMRELIDLKDALGG